MNKFTLRLALVALFAGAAASAHADDVRFDVFSEHLDSGDVWKTTGASWSGSTELLVPLRVSTRLENEERGMGTSRRAFAQAAASLNKSNAVELGFAVGSGAAYALRQERHITWYTAVNDIELSVSGYRVRYATTTLHRVAADVRIPLVEHFALTSRASVGRLDGKFAGGFGSLGLEYEKGAYALTLAGYRGKEPLETGIATSPQLVSNTVLAGLRYHLTDKVSFDVKASHTKAGALTRRGIQGAVVIAY
jgi:opacity protein-like surface antigen